LAAAFTADELMTISRYCRLMADRVVGLVDRTNRQSIEAAGREAAREAGLDSALLEKWWGFAAADFEWHCGEPGETIQ
jgi:hypothetical protein